LPGRERSNEGYKKTNRPRPSRTGRARVKTPSVDVEPKRIDAIRAGDLRVVLVVQRLGSVKGAARALGIAASQVSKTVSRLEEHLASRIFTRGVRGVSLTESGQRLVPLFEDVLKSFDLLQQPPHDGTTEVTIAGEAYLLAAFLPALAAASRGVRVRGIDLPSSRARAYTADGWFDVALLTGTGPLPELWEEQRVGTVRRGLFTTPKLAAQLGAEPVAPERTQEYPFVFPVVRAGDAFLRIDDGCPLPVENRMRGHQAPTMPVALELAAVSDQLVFGPEVAARGYIAQRTLVEVRVRGWEVADPLFCAYDASRLRAPVLRSFLTALTKAAAAR